MVRVRPFHRCSAVILAVLVSACAGSLAGPPASGSVGPRPTEVDCDQDFSDPAASDFVLPFREGRTYRIIQGYCPADPTWGHYGWFAYDFDFPIGDTIVASRAGRVWFVRENRPDIGGDCSGGKENMIIVLHDDGTVMHYAHLTTNSVFVERGSRVEPGQPIGLSGTSGCSSGPHLHVGLYRDSTAFTHENSIPFNYRNAIGPLDANRGLMQDRAYTAGPDHR